MPAGNNDRTVGSLIRSGVLRLDDDEEPLMYQTEFPMDVAKVKRRKVSNQLYRKLKTMHVTVDRVESIFSKTLRGRQRRNQVQLLYNETTRSYTDVERFF